MSGRGTSSPLAWRKRPASWTGRLAPPLASSTGGIWTLLHDQEGPRVGDFLERGLQLIVYRLVIGATRDVVKLAVRGVRHRLHRRLVGANAHGQRKVLELLSRRSRRLALDV